MPDSALPSDPPGAPTAGAAKEKPMRGTVLCIEITLTVESDGTLAREAPVTAAAADDESAADTGGG